jgi:hypothetical protein
LRYNKTYTSIYNPISIYYNIIQQQLLSQLILHVNLCYKYI